MLKKRRRVEERMDAGGKEAKQGIKVTLDLSIIIDTAEGLSEGQLMDQVVNIGVAVGAGEKHVSRTFGDNPFYTAYVIGDVSHLNFFSLNNFRNHLKKLCLENNPVCDYLV